MNGGTFNYEQKFFIENYEVSGVTSIDGGYQINEEPLNILGHGYFDSLVTEPLQGNFSIERSLITRDPLLNYTGEIGFNGGIYYNGTSFDFVSGYLQDYSVSCAVGAIPSVSADIAVYGNIGGRSRTLEKNKVKNYNTTLHHTETGIVKQYVETGILTTGVVRDQDKVKLDAIEWLDYGWKNLSGDHPRSATPILYPEEENEIIQIPDQGSIHISGFGTETNRVQRFSYSLSMPREPIYVVGRDRPVEVQTIPPYEINAEIVIHVDDYEAKNIFDYLIQETSPHKKDLSILVKNSDNTSVIGSYNIPNARLIAENISASANEQLEISLSYQGYYNFLDESIISGSLSAELDDVEIGPEPERECREPTIQVYRPQAKLATSHTQSCFTLNWKGFVIDHEYELDVSKEDPYFNNNNKVLDKMRFQGNGNLQITYSYELCALEPGTVYYYRVRSKNEYGEYSQWSNVVETITIPADPEITSFSDCQDSPSFGFRLNWTASKGVNHYLLDLSDDPNFNNLILDSYLVGTNNYLIQELDAGTIFYSRVRAVNNSGTSSNSQVFVNKSRAPKPTNINFRNVLETEFMLTWSASKLNEGYMVSVYPQGSSTALSRYNRKKTPYTSMEINGLEKGGTYSVVLHVENDCGETSGTSPETITLIPEQVTNISASQCDFYGFTLSWPNITGASEYQIQYTNAVDANGFPVYSLTKNSSVNSYDITNLLAGKKYWYRVRAINSTGEGDYSFDKFKVTIPPAPLIIDSPSTEQDSILLKWNDVDGAESYEVDVSLESNNFNPNLTSYNSKLVEENYLKVTGLTAGQNYVYRIRAVNDCGVSQNSETGTDCTAPPTPTSLSTSAVTPNSFNVSWASVGSGIKYIFDLSKSETMSPLISNYAGIELSTTNISLSNLQEKTEYYFRVRSSNGDCGKSPYSGIVSQITPSKSSLKGLNPPSNCSYYGFTASWIADASSTEYEFNLSEDINFTSFVGSYNNSFRTSSTSITISNLDPGTKYYYRIKAYNQYGSTEYSDPGSILTFPAAPSVTTSNVTATSFDLALSEPESVISYEIDISTTSNFSNFITDFQSYKTSDSSLNIIGLSPNTRYYIRSRSRNLGCGLSQNSSTVNVLTESMPSIPSSLSSGSCTYFGITLSWAAASNATEYNLVLSEDQNFSSFEQGYNQGFLTSSTSQVLTNLDPGKRYFYKVRSKNNYGYSAFSAPNNFLTFPASPNLNIRSITFDSVSLSWNLIQSANKYIIYYKKEGAASYTEIVTTELSQTISGLDSSQKYFIYIKAENNGCGASQASDEQNFTTASLAASVSGLSKVDCFSGGFEVNWANVSDADYYRVNLYEGEVLSTFLNVYQNSTKFNNLSEGFQYQVSVQAGNEYGLSPESTKLSVTTKPASPQNLSITSSTDSSISTSWDSSTSANEYIVEISSNPNFSSIIDSKTTGSTSATFNTGISQDSTYYVRVSASNQSCGEGLKSTAISVTTSSAAPSSVSNIQTSDCNYSGSDFGFTLSWSQAENATSYEVNLSTSSSFSSFVEGFDTSHSTTANSVIFSNLSGGTQYYFRIKPKNKDSEGAYSTVDNITTLPNQVSNLRVTEVGCDDCIDLAWDTSSGVNGYKLYIALDSEYSNTITDYNFKDISSGDNTHEVCNLSKGREYYIKIIGYNDCGEGSPSEISVTTQTEIPTTRISSDIRSDGFTANWSYPEGASYFKFYLSEYSDFSTILSSYNGIEVFTNRVTVSGLTGNVYYFKVEAYNADGETCGQSSSQTTTLTAGPPVTTAASNNIIDCTETGATFSSTAASFTINWNTQLGALGYFLDLSEASTFDSFVTANNNQNQEIYLENFEITGASSNSLDVKNLKTGTLYYYRVRAFNDEGTSLDSNVQTVLTKPFTPGFSVLNIGGTTGATINIIPVFSQSTTSSSTSVNEYNLKIYDSISLTNLVREETFTSTSISISNLAPGFEYYVVAIATNETGDSCESDPYKIETAKSLLKETEFPILQEDEFIILLEQND